MSLAFNYLKIFVLSILFINNINAQSPTVLYNNAGNPTAPSSFEACVGDSVIFTYTNLNKHPNHIQLRNDLGDTVLVAGTTTISASSTSSNKNGSITITIPSNAATGNVKLIDKTASANVQMIYDMNNNLIIHKPFIDFYLPPAPYCATDTIRLIGTPTGGTFSTNLPSTVSNFILNDSILIGRNAGWSTNTNDSIKDIFMSYTYTPKYISGQSCPNSIHISKNMPLRDNRLDTLVFNSIIIEGFFSSYDRISLHLDSPIVQNFSPKLAQNYPVSFSGNYVNRINGIDSFFTENAGYGNHPILMQYDNGGCIGELTADLEVLTSIQLTGIVDTLCKDADIITIKRDTNSKYAYYMTTDTFPVDMYGSIYVWIDEYNIIDSIYMNDYINSLALSQVNPLSQEEYNFDPSLAVLDSATIIMRTLSKFTWQELDTLGNIIWTNTFYDYFFVEYPILLTDRPTVDFTLDSTYCKNSGIVNLAPTAPFSSFSYISSSPSIADSLPSHQFDTDSIYNQAFPLAPQNQDLDIQFICTVNRHGCIDSDTQSTRIHPIPDVSLNGLAPHYCANNPSVQLNGLPLPNSPNSLAKYSGSGIIDTIQGTFSPSIAGVGTKEISYSFEAENGCTNSVAQTTTIYPIPVLQFNFPQNQYCIADTIIFLDQNSALGTYTFWGNIIDSTNILNIKDTTGQQTVFYALTDNQGCTDTSSINILINPLPTITISGLDSAYCFNSSIDNISVAPTPINGTISGSSAGFSINNLGGVSFNPNYDNSGVKSFRYTYTDNTTDCSNSIILNTRVHDVPTLSYTGIDSAYCAIDSSYSIVGIPAGGRFSGAGVSDTGNQYYFNPIFTGGGNRTLRYTIDSSILYGTSDTLLCSVEMNIPIVINALPILNFGGPSNYSQFCSNDADTLLRGLEPIPTWRLFTSNTLNAIDSIITSRDSSTGPNTFVRLSDTSYFFSPSNAGPGDHYITYIATNAITGCQDSISRIYQVKDFGNGASFLLDSAYCASSYPVQLNGIPVGGSFYRNQDSLDSPHLLNLNTSVQLIDTIIYTVTYGACMDSDTQTVTISPLIDSLSFSGYKHSKTYCKGDQDSYLYPNIPGGTFSGDAVIAGDSSLFSLQYANRGKNLITYTFIDSITYCQSTVTDTFFVFGMPNVDFSVNGGCQSDNIFFNPDNAILSLTVRDSITNIVWELNSATSISGSLNSNNNINSISHVFNTPGIYDTKLSVTNRTHCTNTNTVQVIISPTIRRNQFPYDETFENSNGNWYAEAKSASHNLLWEWGSDTIPQGINEPNNKIWATQLNHQYQANEAAWVYSPCFDISSLKRPMIRFDHWSDSRDRGDGTVLEFQNPDGTWSPMGELDRGINWFNSGFIAGAPGAQTLSPVGWSGKSNGWINSRYKLDDFQGTTPSKLRLRMAFGSSSIHLGSNFYNGFAFDNVWIGNRTRNVLLETTSNIYEPNMDNINKAVHQLVYHSNINKDVILLQYHSAAPNDKDQFHQYNRATPNARTLFYGIFDAGTAFINGIDHTKSEWLNELSFEQGMLESPKFKVEIDTFYHVNPGQFTLTTTVTALVNIPAVKRYRINMLITEDSLSYTTTRQVVHAVVRKDYPSNNINTFDRSWVTGDQVTLTHTYSTTDLNYVPNHFQAVVFIQAQLDSAREVFQTATTRDIHGYWVGIDQVAAEQELNEIKDIRLYPNPAKDYINIDFPESLKNDYQWKLVSIAGISVKEDVIHTGEQSLTINNYDLPSGVYIFMVYNGSVYSQRKVIINQD